MARWTEWTLDAPDDTRTTVFGRFFPGRLLALPARTVQIGGRIVSGIETGTLRVRWFAGLTLNHHWYDNRGRVWLPAGFEADHRSRFVDIMISRFSAVEVTSEAGSDPPVQVPFVPPTGWALSTMVDGSPTPVSSLVCSEIQENQDGATIGARFVAPAGGLQTVGAWSDGWWRASRVRGESDVEGWVAFAFGTVVDRITWRNPNTLARFTPLAAGRNYPFALSNYLTMQRASDRAAASRGINNAETRIVFSVGDILRIHPKE